MAAAVVLDKVTPQVLFTAVGEEEERWELVQDYIYPFADTYSGPAESCLFEFKLLPEQFPGADWITTKILNSFGSEMTKRGREMLVMKVWEDTGPVLWTNYQVFMVYTDPEASATALGFQPLAAPVVAIIAAVLLVIFLISLVFIVKEINKLWYGEEGKPGLGDIIPLLIVVMMMAMIMPMMQPLKEKPPEGEKSL